MFIWVSSCPTRKMAKLWAEIWCGKPNAVSTFQISLWLAEITCPNIYIFQDLMTCSFLASRFSPKLIQSLYEQFSNLHEQLQTQNPVSPKNQNASPLSCLQISYSLISIQVWSWRWCEWNCRLPLHVVVQLAYAISPYIGFTNNGVTIDEAASQTSYTKSQTLA